MKMILFDNYLLRLDGRPRFSTILVQACCESIITYSTTAHNRQQTPHVHNIAADGLASLQLKSWPMFSLISFANHEHEQRNPAHDDEHTLAALILTLSPVRVH